MNYQDSTPLRCAIEIPMTTNPANCDAEPCGMYADFICAHCGLPLCYSCEAEFPCCDSRDGKHKAESECELYLGRVQPDFRNAAIYRKAAIEAAKERDFRGAFLSIAAALKVGS